MALLTIGNENGHEVMPRGRTFKNPATISAYAMY